jgi:hypothetical protein
VDERGGEKETPTLTYLHPHHPPTPSSSPIHTHTFILTTHPHLYPYHLPTPSPTHSAGGISSCVSTCITFLSRNTSSQTKRATLLAFMISVDNCGRIVSGQIDRSEDAPRFIMDHAINLGFCTLTIICTSILVITLRLENRRRDRLYGSITTQSLFCFLLIYFELSFYLCGLKIKFDYNL